MCHTRLEVLEVLNLHEVLIVSNKLTANIIYHCEMVCIFSLNCTCTNVVEIQVMFPDKIKLLKPKRANDIFYIVIEFVFNSPTPAYNFNINIQI